MSSLLPIIPEGDFVDNCVMVSGKCDGCGLRKWKKELFFYDDNGEDGKLCVGCISENSRILISKPFPGTMIRFGSYCILGSVRVLLKASIAAILADIIGFVCPIDP